VRILFVASELAPLAQTGGLGDAVAGLAGALADEGHEVVCALPGYRELREHPMCPPLEERGEVAWQEPEGERRGRWLGAKLPSGVGLRVLELPSLYDRPGLYAASPEDAPRFIALGRAGARLALEGRFDALVAHDWHAALAIGSLRLASVIAGGLGIGPTILYGVSGGQEHGLDFLFVGKACVIGTDGDGEVFHIP
jgi:starch synthase